jgi:hypothetical protein
LLVVVVALVAQLQLVATAAVVPAALDFYQQILLPSYLTIKIVILQMEQLILFQLLLVAAAVRFKLVTTAVFRL